MRILCLLLLFPVLLFAQQKGWQELTISDGLSQGMIFDLVQDKKGFIWIATKDGLNRYDGHNFTVFTHSPPNPYSLSGNGCSALLMDRGGRLWVGTLNQGLNLFDTRTQRFYHIDIRDKLAANAGNYAIHRLYEDPNGSIWVTANETKLIKITLPERLRNGFPEQANFTQQVQISQASIPEKSVGVINHISFQANGQALAVGTVGQYRLNWKYPQKKGIYKAYSRSWKGLSATYCDVNQNLVVGSQGDRLIMERQDRQKTIILPKGYEVAAVVSMFDAKTLAIATNKFLWQMSPNELFRQDSLSAHNAFAALPANLYGVTRMLRDQTGNIWLGTSGYGLRKFNPKVKRFHSTLPNTTATYLYVDKQGRTYVRHEFAYDQFDPKTERLKPFLPDDLSAADKRARYLMQDRKGIFWVSNTNFQTKEMSLFKFSSDWKLLKKYPLPPHLSFGFYDNQTIEDQAGRLWIGVLNGKILQFDPATETFQVFSYQSLLPQKGADIETSALYFDQAGILWIGTTKGLIRADLTETKPTFSLYKNSIADPKSLSNDLVSSILDDPDEPNRYLWVGTKGGNLDRLDKKTGHFDHITEEQGLPNNVIYGILSDEFKNLWLSTNRGLAQFNPRTKTFRNFTKADGLQDDEFNTGSFFKAPSGELLFGGVHGLTTFRASDVIRSGNTAPQVNLIGLKVNNETVKVGAPNGILSQSIEYTQRIDLSHNQNLLTLEFGVMDFANAAKNRYRYRLEGIDQSWVKAGTNRFANYAQLPFGHYTFQLIGSTDGQVWSKPVNLEVFIHPPFYRTWWAYLLYASALIVIAWQLYKLHTQRLLLEQRIVFEQKEASRLAELDSLKTQLFTNISHEFRTPLTLILGPLEQIIQEYAEDTRFPLIQRNASRLLSLINQLLDLSKFDAGQLKPESTSGNMVAFFQAVSSSFEALSERKQLRFTVEQSEREWWAEFDQDKLEKIVTNLLSNAFKFTPAGQEVSLVVQYPVHAIGGNVILTVEDTGVGIAPAHLPHIFERFYQRPTDGKTNFMYEGTGIGLALVNELVKVLKGTISVTSTEGKGTIFTVSIPVVVPTAPVNSLSKSGELVEQSTVPSRLQKTPIDSKTQPVDGDDHVLLVIDDNADIRTYVRSIFDGDYQVIEAVDGKEGLELATKNLPNLVICDLMMPRLDGFGFCQALKTQVATSHIPVIMLTAKATLEDRIEGFGLGADDYLTKPFNQAELKARVQNLIRQRHQLYQLFRSNQDASLPKLAKSVLSPAEQQFLDQLSAIIHQRIDDTTFTVEDLANAVHLSRVQLHRKLKAVADTSASSFIRDIRLAKAAQLLTEGSQNVTQVAYAVGFDNLSYFARVFQERYQILPSQYGKSRVS